MGMNLGQVTELYLKLRAKDAQMKKRHSEERKPILEKMEKIENAILAHFQKTGQTSSKTDYGTPYISTRDSATVADREAFLAFVIEGGNLHFLESKANKTAVKEYMEEHEEPPPGVKYTSEQKINVRSS